VVVAPPPTPAPAITVQTTTPPPPAPVTIAPAPAPTPAPAPPAPAAAPAAPPRLAQGDARQCAPTAADYPPAAVRAEATGTTVVRFTVDASGKLAGTPEVVRSAGSSREHRLLDRVAVTKLSECKFSPGRDAAGNPTGGSFTVEYVWKLS
jgi:protein TonB